MGRMIGYARVSTLDQSLELQVHALQQAGCEVVLEDRMSGTKTSANRPGLSEALALAYQEPNSSLAVWKLDRLGRGVKGLVDLVGELESRGVQFRSLTESIDTSTPAGRLFFHVLAAMGQMERELIVERTQAGLENAKRNGIRLGRPRKLNPGRIEAARSLLASGMRPRAVAQSLGVSVPTLYRWLPASGREAREESVP